MKDEREVEIEYETIIDSELQQEMEGIKDLLDSLDPEGKVEEINNLKVKILINHDVF